MTVYIADLETLSLDPVFGLIVEVGVLAVTDDLQTEIASFERLVQAPQSAIDAAPEIVKQMHSVSGLWDDLSARGRPRAEVRADLATWLVDHADSEAPYTWGGSGVNHYDSAVLAAQWPEIRALLGYKAIYDVSAPRAFAALAGRPEIVSTEPCLHRALPDCRFALQQAQGYLAMLREGAA